MCDCVAAGHAQFYARTQRGVQASTLCGLLHRQLAKMNTPEPWLSSEQSIKKRTAHEPALKFYRRRTRIAETTRLRRWPASAPGLHPRLPTRLRLISCCKPYLFSKLTIGARNRNCGWLELNKPSKPGSSAAGYWATG